LPIAQARHEVAPIISEYLPGSHVVQPPAVVDAVEKDPARQAMQSASSCISADDSIDLPGSQEMQTLAPEKAYLPIVHQLHVVWDSALKAAE
jgi:hypothetical protein